MNNKLTMGVALAAGVCGSAIMQYLAPPLAFAQVQMPVAKEIRAQSFRIVDQSSNVIGVFTSEPVQGAVRDVPGTSTQKVPMRIVLRDQNGCVIWSPDVSTKLLPLTMK
ncbi:MAG: hypothetical protein QOJ99_508 [Bryobacterales bacterium]|jgi:hypothetical protein|nr:hypothetical protein [Bryobacterales bacterium]